MIDLNVRMRARRPHQVGSLYLGEGLQQVDSLGVVTLGGFKVGIVAFQVDSERWPW